MTSYSEISSRLHQYIITDCSDKKYKRFSEWNMDNILKHDKHKWISDDNQNLIIIGIYEKEKLIKIKVDTTKCVKTKMRSLQDRDKSTNYISEHKLLLSLTDTFGNCDFNSIKKKIININILNVVDRLNEIISMLLSERDKNPDTLKLGYTSAVKEYIEDFLYISDSDDNDDDEDDL